MITVTLEEHEDKTTPSVRQGGMPADQMSEGAATGWAGAFDKLAVSLASA